MYKKGDKIICIKDFSIYAKKHEIHIVDEHRNGYIIIKSENKIGSITIINKTLNEYFISLSKYRDMRISEILE